MGLGTEKGVKRRVMKDSVQSVSFPLKDVYVSERQHLLGERTQINVPITQYCVLKPRSLCTFWFWGATHCQAGQLRSVSYHTSLRVNLRDNARRAKLLITWDLRTLESV